MARHILDCSPLAARVLLVPHQGSKTSSTPAFVDAVAPELAVVSAGYRNSYGHPAPEVLARYRERGIGVINTAALGAIDLRYQDGALRWTGYRHDHRRYWSAP